MHLLPLIFSVALLDATFASASLQRKEWRALRKTEQLEYIHAVKCLQHLPSIGTHPQAKSHFDDFQAAHIVLADEIHIVGQFLPWHRRFMQVFEAALKQKCGYKGANPYWNWSIDADAGVINNSPVFDSVYGFGGNGIDVAGYNGPFNNMSNLPGWVYESGGGCIQDGPFASYNLSLGPGTLATNHCLQRAFTNFMITALSSAAVANTSSLTSFEEFRTELEGVPTKPLTMHGAGHIGVGAEMSNLYSSPGDPLFYLHHTNLDRIWWEWQIADSKDRLYAISGRSSVDPPFVNVTLDFQLKMLNLAPLVPIRDVMDIRKLGYKYV